LQTSTLVNETKKATQLTERSVLDVTHPHRALVRKKPEYILNEVKI